MADYDHMECVGMDGVLAGSLTLLFYSIHACVCFIKCHVQDVSRVSVFTYTIHTLLIPTSIYIIL